MKRYLQITAIVLFVIVDLVAAVLSVRYVNQRPTSTGTPVVVASEKPSPTVSTPTEPAEVAPNGLSVNRDLVALFVKGSCDQPGGAKIEVSDDRAKTFKEIALPLEDEPDANGNRGVAVTSVLSVTLANPAELSIIATGIDCQAIRYTTEDAGENWKREDAIGEWHVENARVVTPDGPLKVKCDVVSLSLINDIDAKVGCKDDEIRGSADGGDTWQLLGFLEGIDAVTFVDFREGRGIATTTGCKSRVYKTASAGATWTPIACIDKGSSVVALSVSGGLLGALADGEIYFSTDQGKTWKRP